MRSLNTVRWVLPSSHLQMKKLSQNVNSRSGPSKERWCGIKTIGEEIEFGQAEKEGKVLQAGGSMSPNSRQDVHRVPGAARRLLCVVTNVAAM